MYMEEPQKKRWTSDKALENARKYCAYQERCHSEVRYKLLSHGIYGDFLEEIIAVLIEENYLNEERFAVQFAGGKHRIKGWGKQKIIQELKSRQVSEYSIRTAILSISHEEENERLSHTLEKKIRVSKSPDKASMKNELIKYAMSKGYQYNDIVRLLDSILDRP